MLELKQSDFRPAYKNQVNFDHQHKTESIDPHKKSKSFSARTQKPTPFWPPHKKQVNFDQNKNEVSSDAPRHKSQVNFDPDCKPYHFQPPHRNQVNSDPYTEIKSIPILRTKIKTISTTHTTIKSNSMSKLKPCMSLSARVILRVIHTDTHVPVIQQQCVSHKYQ